MLLASGDTIDRYVIEAPLGMGGMGEVYRARDTRLHRTVALKILRTEHAAGTTDRAPGSSPSDGSARLVREARAAAALDHPNVVAIFDVGQLDEPGPLQGVTYLAMELIKGRSLPAFIGDPEIDMPERVRWLLDIAKALSAAHDAGLIHRDVKPDNIMIRDDGIVKVLDFGIARRTAGAPVKADSATEDRSLATFTAQGVIVGTPLYMAPEQARGEALDGRVDQFAWGVVAYELLTGAPPWSHTEGAMVLLAQILSATPASLDRFVDIPIAVRQAVFRALEKSRNDRFPTMRDLVESIEGTSSTMSHRGRLSVRGSTPAGPHDPTLAADGMPSSVGKIARASAETQSAANAAVSRTTGERAPNTVPSVIASRPRSWVAGVAVALVCAVVGLGVWMKSRTPTSTQVGSTPSASGSAALPACSPSACSRDHAGEAWTCRPSDHQCVAIASEDCIAKFEPTDLHHDDTTWIGVLVPRRGKYLEDQGSWAMNAAELARKELSESARMVEQLPAGKGVRRLATVVCDDSEDPMRAAKHMVEDLGAPAIVGFQNAAEVLDLAGHLLLSSGTLVVPTMTGDPLVTRLPQPPDSPRLVWRSTYGLTGVADAAARFIGGALEPRRHATTDTRVALVRMDTPQGFAFGETFFRSLTFNGKSALANGTNYGEHVFAPRSTPEQLDALGAKVAAQAPDFVVFLGRTETQTALMDAIERHWEKTRASRPSYLCSDDSVEPHLAFAGSDASRRHRIFAVNTALDPDRGARFVLRYNQSYAGGATRNDNPSPTYDAIYLVDYAMLAAQGPITGASLARAIPRLLPPGPAVESGPGSLLGAISGLASGGSIDFQGASGDLDFDPKTGEAGFDFDLRCMGIDRQGKADREIQSGLTLQARTHAIEGTMKCP